MIPDAITSGLIAAAYVAVVYGGALLIIRLATMKGK